MYHKMDLEYSVKCFNNVIVEGEYLESGYTSNINRSFKENPVGYYCYFAEILNRSTKGIKFNKRLYVIKHYILFKTISKKNNIYIKDLLNKLLYYFLIIPGKIATKIKYK